MFFPFSFQEKVEDASVALAADELRVPQPITLSLVREEVMNLLWNSKETLNNLILHPLSNIEHPVSISYLFLFVLIVLLKMI
jgi:hypothetical protein